MAVVLFIRGKRFLFLGESGTGKSTHTRLWRENIAGSKLLNDDSPIVRYEKGACGYMAARGVGRLLVIRRSVIRWPDVYVCHKHRITRYGDLNTLQAYAALHPSAPPAFAYEEELYCGVCSLLEKDGFIHSCLSSGVFARCGGGEISMSYFIWRWV